MGAIFKIWDTYISPATDEGMDIGAAALEFKDLYIDGKAYIDGLGQNLLVDLDIEIEFGDSAVNVSSQDDGHLDLTSDGNIDFVIGATEQLTLTDGKLAPTTDDDIDLGDSTHEFKDVYIDGILYADAIQDHGLTATRVVFAGASGLLTDDADMTFATDTLTVTKIGQTTFTAFPLTPSEAPDADYEVANKKYVDDNALDFTTLVFYDSDLIGCDSDAVYAA